MRTKLTFYNMIVSLISQFIFLILSIVFPRLIILVFGSEVNGLTSSINQILNIVNLLQAGVVGASIYDMYRPISENNNKLLGTIFYSSKQYFNKLSKIFLFIGIVFIPLFLLNSKNNISFIEMMLSVFILTLNGAIIFKYVSSYDIIISAHQKKYILVYSSLIEKIIYYVLLLLVLHLRVHFIFMYLALICGTLARIIFLNVYFKKNYYNKIKMYTDQKNYKVKNQYYLLSNQIIQQIIESAPTLIISSFYGLATVSIFSLYNMIVSAFKMIFSTIQNSISASFGDLSVSDKNHAQLIFDVIHLLFINLGQITSSCMIVLCIPFIKLYSSGISDINYINSYLAISMSLLSLSYCVFMPYNLAINANGEYRSVTRQNFIYGIISILLAVILSLQNYVFCILVFSLFYILSSIDRIKVIQRKIFNICLITHIRRIIIAILIPVIYYFLFNDLVINTWTVFILYGFIHVLILTLIIIIIDFCFERKTLMFILTFIKERI